MARLIFLRDQNPATKHLDWLAVRRIIRKFESGKPAHPRLNQQINFFAANNGQRIIMADHEEIAIQRLWEDWQDEIAATNDPMDDYAR